MVQCTQCHSELDEDFGLVTCQNCGAQLLIEIDGQVVDASAKEASGAESSESSVQKSAVQELTQNMLSELEDIDEGSVGSDHNTGVFSEDEGVQSDNLYETSEPVTAEAHDDELEDNLQNSYQLEDGVVDETNDYDEDSKYEGSKHEDSGYEEAEHEGLHVDQPSSLQAEESLANYQGQSEESQQNGSSELRGHHINLNTDWPEPLASEEDQNSLKEIQDYANSEASNLEAGALLYDLRVQGVDTKELRKQIIECLSDSRLGLNTEGFVIEQGQFILTGLNPVVVSIIVQRLKPLPVFMDWRQNAVFY